jgi:hypothetical protein
VEYPKLKTLIGLPVSMGDHSMVGAAAPKAFSMPGDDPYHRHWPDHRRWDLATGLGRWD